MIKPATKYRAESDPRLKAYWVRRPATAAGRHSLTARLARPSRPLSLAGSVARCAERAPVRITVQYHSGQRGHRRLATGLGAVAPTARASARYEGPTVQHESGGGSPGRWHNIGTERSAQGGDVSKLQQHRTRRGGEEHRGN
jgi:hypothetical protein